MEDLEMALEPVNSVDGAVLGEVVEIPTDRPFMSTPFEDYTVSEGLLLVLVISFILGFVFQLWKEVF